MAAATSITSEGRHTLNPIALGRPGRVLEVAKRRRCRTPATSDVTSSGDRAAFSGDSPRPGGAQRGPAWFFNARSARIFQNQWHTPFGRDRCGAGFAANGPRFAAGRRRLPPPAVHPSPVVRGGCRPRLRALLRPACALGGALIPSLTACRSSLRRSSLCGEELQLLSSANPPMSLRVRGGQVYSNRAPARVPCPALEPPLPCARADR